MHVRVVGPCQLGPGAQAEPERLQEFVGRSRPGNAAAGILDRLRRARHFAVDGRAATQQQPGPAFPAG
ncbi:hypothetical protein G6F68_014255 [Rhizopus microsporus]|nr:hypothetical protein G6F68_014255 [Rhizopus microsporus]